MKPPKLAIVVPCYNEEEVLPETIKRLTSIISELSKKEKIADDSFIVFIDDGSQDKTWEIIEKVATESVFIKGIKLSRNFGHQNALLAGMEYVADKCDCMISIDADLQQDETKIEVFIDKFLSGSEIIYGVRNDRRTDSFFKKITALSFYKLMLLMGVNIIKNHADYRLLSNRAVKFLLQFQESNLFLRGLVALIGLKNDYVFFDYRERYAGKSKYTLKKMLSLAWNGITSFSIIPLRLITIGGFLIFLISMLLSLHVLYVALFTDKAVPGWASTVLPIYLLGGIQMLSMGLIGEYIGKIYMETKRRPKYLIDKVI